MAAFIIDEVLDEFKTTNTMEFCEVMDSVIKTNTKPWQPKCAKDPPQKMSLHWILQNGDEKDIASFLDNNINNTADLDQLDDHGNAPLHLAIIRNYENVNTYRVLETLISRGANVNVKANNESKTPLHLVVEQRHEKSFLLLINNGADPNIVDADGNNALHLAVATEHRKHSVLKCLLENGAKVDAANNIGKTPFDYVLAEANEQTYRLFVDHGAELPGTNELSKILMNRSLDVTRVIDPEYRRSIEERLHGRVSPYLHQAVQHAAVYNVRYALAQGVDVNKRDCFGNTPLHWFFLYPPADLKLSSYEVCRFLDMLLDAGADVEATNKRNQSVLCGMNRMNRKPFLCTLAKRAYFESTKREATLEWLRDYPKLRDYVNDCFRELESLRDFVFYDNASLLPVLMNDKPSLKLYSCNRNLHEAFSRCDVMRRFPIYGEFLARRVSSQISRTDFRRKAIESLGECLPEEARILEVLENVVTFLHDYDLIEIAQGAKRYRVNQITGEFLECSQ